MLWAGPPGYPTPVFDAGDPLVCHTLKLRPSLWAVVFDTMQRLAVPYAWIQADVGAATPDEVAAEIEKATDETVFAGCVMIGQVMWLATDAPAWTLVCDGGVHLKADHPQLWAVMNVAYEVSMTEFRVPDMIARFPLGSSTLGDQGGDAEQTLDVANIPTHYHSQDQFGAAASTVLGELPGFEIAPVPGVTGSTGSGDPFSIMPPYETLLPVIIARFP